MPTPPAINRLVGIASSLLLIGVGLGAFGAHAMRPALEAAGRVSTWETAVHYHLVHGVALFALGLFSQTRADSAPSKLPAWGARLMTAGVLLFSGSLYGICLGGPAWLGPVTPLGGIFLLLAWLCLAIWALRPAAVQRN